MFDQRAFTDGTPRRVSASSITSSWYSDPRCTSSTAAPPVTTSARGRRARARRRVARAQREGRAQPFAARGQQVPGDVAEEPVVGADGVVQALFDPHQVGGEGREPDVVDQRHDSTAPSLRRASGAPVHRRCGGYGDRREGVDSGRLGMIRAARA